MFSRQFHAAPKHRSLVIQILKKYSDLLIDKLREKCASLRREAFPVVPECSAVSRGRLRPLRRAVC